MSERDTHRFPNLALFDGGPFVSSLRLARLRGDELRQLCWRRTIFLVVITWLPLLLFAAAEGQLLGETTAMPLLMDTSIHVRFLIALPLLIMAEIGVDKHARGALDRFIERELVPDQELPRFHTAVASALRLRDSWIAEIVLLLVVLTLAIGHFNGQYLSLNEASVAITSWYSLAGRGNDTLSLAGLWFTFVSLPLFQFLTLRWYYRIFIWGKLLWRVTRLDLHLIPTHPDRVAGLGFLAQTAFAYIPLALAHGSMLSALLVNRILYADQVLTDFKVEIVVMVAFVLCLVLVPLLLFGPKLMAASLRGVAEYGSFASSVVRAFDKRWLRDSTRARSELLDVGEVSAMTDLDTTLGIIREMRYVPVTREAVLWIAAAVLAPMLPLLLTVMPAEELLTKLLGMLL